MFTPPARRRRRRLPPRRRRRRGAGCRCALRCLRRWRSFWNQIRTWRSVRPVRATRSCTIFLVRNASPVRLRARCTPPADGELARLLRLLRGGARGGGGAAAGRRAGALPPRVLDDLRGEASVCMEPEPPAAVVAGGLGARVGVIAIRRFFIRTAAPRPAPGGFAVVRAPPAARGLQ